MSLTRTCCVVALVWGLAAAPLSSQNPTSQCSAEYLPVAGQSSVSVSIEPSQSLVRTTIQVAAHQALQYNFALTQGTTLTARFQVAGGMNNSIKVLLVDAENYQRYVAHQQYNYFQGTTGSVRGIGHYIFRVPRDDIYYLILDNSEAWLLPRSVNLYVYTVLPEKSPETINSEQTAADSLNNLGKFFAFPPFQVEIKHCGVVNAFSNPNITICTELVESLHDQNLDQAIPFVLFHEMGHTLLRQWGYPLWDNEDAADEFATVMIILGKQQPMALQAAQWWSSQTSQQEALSKLWADDRHTVSPQRARNIIHWLSESDQLTQRWFRIFLPNMQTSVLVTGLTDPNLPFSKDLLKAELRKRGCVQ